jgi:hypothetical protein
MRGRKYAGVRGILGMPSNKENLIDRLDKMFWLERDWDGFGTGPICKKSHDVAIQMINYIEVDVTIKVFVGVEPEGSVFVEITKQDSPTRIELVVMPDGSIEYEELQEAKLISRGGFLLSFEAINEILR